MTITPREIFIAETHPPNTRVMIAPGRYIQGDGVFDQLGRYLGLIPASKVGILISPGGLRRLGDRLSQTMQQAGVTFQTLPFEGECAYAEVERCVAQFQAFSLDLDALIAIGGGKCLDAGKAIAHRLGVPIIICPTIASTDAPTSAVAVMYDEDGLALGGEFYPHSPAMVVVDSGIIAAAPARYLAAGIADALASVYELRINLANPNGRSMVGGRPTFSVAAMVEVCRSVLLRDGLGAVEAVKQNRVTHELENVIEANTLSSGIGFESGGLAVAHAVAKGLTAIPHIRQNHLHGEQIAIGILAQLSLLEEVEEIGIVSNFFQSIDLPICLSDIGISASDQQALDQVIRMALDAPFVHNVGFQVSAEKLLQSLSNLEPS